MLREWLMRPEVVLWSFGFVPVAVLLVYVSVMGVRSRRRAERPRRMVVWLLPAVVLFMAYYMWGFQTPLVKAVLYVGVGTLFCLAGALLLDGVYVSTQRFLSSGAGERESTPDRTWVRGADSDDQAAAESRHQRSEDSDSGRIQGD